MHLGWVGRGGTCGLARWPAHAAPAGACSRGSAVLAWCTEGTGGWVHTRHGGASPVPTIADCLPPCRATCKFDNLCLNASTLEFEYYVNTDLYPGGQPWQRHAGAIPTTWVGLAGLMPRFFGPARSVRAAPAARACAVRSPLQLPTIAVQTCLWRTISWRRSRTASSRSTSSALVRCCCGSQGGAGQRGAPRNYARCSGTACCL